MRHLVLRVLLLSLVLVVILEVLLVLGGLATGGLSGADDVGSVVADLLEKVPWSLFVCTGIWVGLELGHGRLPLSLLAGLVAAPVGSLLLRAVAEGAHAFAFADAPAVPRRCSWRGSRGSNTRPSAS